MADRKYAAELAEKFIFAEGWDKYHDRFFTRCYMQEAEDAFNAEVDDLRSAQKHRK
jgi:fructosamine-3-kinase